MRFSENKKFPHWRRVFAPCSVGAPARSWGDGGRGGGVLCMHPATGADAAVPAHNLSGMGGPGHSCVTAGSRPGYWTSRCQNSILRSAREALPDSTPWLLLSGGDVEGMALATCVLCLSLCAGGSQLLRPANDGEVAHTSSLRSQPQHSALLSPGDKKQ